jgi:hypothetical protein
MLFLIQFNFFGILAKYFNFRRYAKDLLRELIDYNIYSAYCQLKLILRKALILGHLLRANVVASMEWII